MEGSTFEAFCDIKHRKSIVCTHFSLCKLKPVWYKTQKTLDELYQTITLKMIADATGGRYFNAQDAEKLKNIYAEIDQLEKTVSEGRLYTEYRELYESALFPGLALMLAQIVLVSTRFRSLP